MFRHALLRRTDPTGLRTVRFASTSRPPSPSPPRPPRSSRGGRGGGPSSASSSQKPPSAPTPGPRPGPGPSSPDASAGSGASASSKADPPRSDKIATMRRIVLTGAVALITISGALTGAKLKMDGDAAKQQKQYTETPVEERIAMLEDRRAALVAMKIPLERKLAGLQGRMAAAAAAAAAEHKAEGQAEEDAGREP